jgi:hypothetical protein
MADLPKLYIPENIKPAQLSAIGGILWDTFATYEKDRRGVEEQWLKNLRQFRGIYDPEIEKIIPSDQSRAYPKLTRQKVIGTVARLMEMLFPRTDKNYSVRSSTLPNLSQADVQLVLDQLVAEKGADLTDAVIEAGLKSLADEKAKLLEREIDDQLEEIDYVSLAKQVVFSAVLYGPGLLKGPGVVEEEGRTWTKGPDGAWKASTVKVRKPFYEFVRCWDVYTDLSAKVLSQTDAEFQRHILTRVQVQDLAKRPDFMADQINGYLNAHRTGNYKPKWWENELRSKSADQANIAALNGRKFEAIEFWGRLTGQQLKDCGIAVPDEQLGLEIEANVWMIDNTVIKAVMNPYDSRTRGFHWFIYEEDDINLLGNGLPVCMRDSQMAVAEAARMILDNGSVVCGPQLEVNHTLLMPGQDLAVYARKVWLREDSGIDAQTPAVRNIAIDSHIPELISIVDLFMGFADAETALPPSALGDVSGQGKESLRTTGNLSMLLGAAALPIRDTVRNYDRFTKSFISSLGYWNMEFNPKPGIKGDFTVLAVGSTSLIAKEVRANALNLLSTTLTPEERMHISTRKMVTERIRVLDLPEELLEDEKVVIDKLAEQARSAQATAQQQGELMRAQIKGEVASAWKDLMLGLKAQAGANADTFNTIVEAVLNERTATADAAAAQAGGGGASPKGAGKPSRSGVAGAS